MLVRQFLRLAFPCIALLPCACDSDNVSWAFVSNPSGSTGNGSGGIVIVVHSGGSNGATLPTQVLQVSGHDDRGELTAFLPHGGDVAVLARTDGAELRSPVLPVGRIELPGARVSLHGREATAVQVSLPASELVHRAVSGPGFLHIAATGTLLVLEGSYGFVILGERPDPEFVPPTAILTTTLAGDHLALLIGGRLRPLIPPPPPAMEQRLESVQERRSLRLLGPFGERLAELPAANVHLQHGIDGLFLVADVPPGTIGAPATTTLVMARDNRYLLRIDAR